jgi:lipopolysaccharide exporter
VSVVIPTAPQEEPSVERKALRGVPWTFAAFVLSRGTQLIGTLVVAHLVPPSQIGVVLTGLLVVNTLNLLSDNGISISLIVRRELNHRIVNTAFTMMMGLAATCVVLAWALAHPISNAFGSPRLADVLPLLALTVVTSTINWFFTNMLQREMMWRARFAGQFSLAIGYVVVAVPCAALGAGVWALVAGQIAAGVLSSVVLWNSYPHRVRLSFHRPEARQTFTESRPYVSQAASSFLIDNGHFVAVSALLGAAPMALYTMSYRLAQLPNLALSAPVGDVALPAYVQLRDDKERRLGVFFTMTRHVTLATVLPLAILAAAAPDFIGVILGPHWRGMQGILRLLCAWGVIMVPAGTVGWYVNVMGGSRFMSQVNMARLVFLTPLVFVAAAVWNSLELVGAVIVGDVAVEIVVLALYASAKQDVSLFRFFGALRVPVAAGFASAAAVLGLHAGLGTMSQLPRFIVEIAAGIVAYVGAVQLLDRTAIRELWTLARTAVAR